MFWSKKTNTEKDPAINCAEQAEELYRSGKYHCAEAVLETIRRRFTPETAEEIVHSVNGFGGGSNAGCICGAVSGGTVALGLVLKEKKRTAQMTGELHKWFKEQYQVTCCKTIRAKNDKGICPQITGAVAGKIAEMLFTNRKGD